MPANSSSQDILPVKSWAYGGFNEVGFTSYPVYDPCHLAKNAVVVASQFRVGPLEFLGLQSAGIQGNMAVRDYLAALISVEENIVSFGGKKTLRA